jgi:hypothetical protein
MAPNGSLGMIRWKGRIFESAGALYNDLYAEIAPGDIRRISVIPQDGNGDSIDAEVASFLIDDLDHSLGPVAVKKPMEGAVDRILFDRLGHGMEILTDGPSLVYDDSVEVLPAYVMPKGKLADSSETVDSKDAVL